MISATLIAAVIGWGNIGFAQVPGTPLAGNPGFILEFDEAGHGQIIGPGGLVPDPGVPQLGGGIEFFLPVPVVAGDVLVFSPLDAAPNNPNGFSDLLTFFNSAANAGNGVLFYRSVLDETEPFPDPADVLGLVAPGTPFSTIESGPEGNNGFVWIVGDPAGPSYTVYNGISDTPEPSTFILGGLGLIGLFLIRRRRRAAA